VRPFYFHPGALAEAEAAAAFFDERMKGLGLRFLTEMTEAINRIRMNPAIYRKIEGEVRKCRVKHFPYAVVFRERAQEIEIIAVMQLRREPGYCARNQDLTLCPNYGFSPPITCYVSIREIRGKF
jgi:ATP-dependent RNA circularization protein (DNA/RNA ligase family)